jgi:DNA-binding response OmpR family regulator
MVDSLRQRYAADPEVLEDAYCILSQKVLVGRILLIEDHREAVSWLSSALSSYEILSADTYDKAINSIENDGLDLVVVSVDTRSLDGLRFCSQIRANPSSRQIPILALVSDKGPSELILALNIGVNDYVIRPIDKNEIVARVRNLLRKKRYVDLLLNKAAPVMGADDAIQRLSRQDPLGASATAVGEKLSLQMSVPDVAGFETDVTKQFQLEAARKLEVLASKTGRLGNSQEWKDLSLVVSTLRDEINRSPDEYAKRSLVMWSLSVSLGSFLEQSRGARSDPRQHDSLEPDIERAVSDVVLTVAPFVRSHSTAQRFDSELISFNVPSNSVDVASRLTTEALSRKIIDVRDAALLAASLTNPGSRGVQSQKSHGFGVKTTLNLLGAALVIVASGGVKKLAEKAVDRAAEKSQLVAKLADMLLATEGDVVALCETAAPDLRAAATEVIRFNKQ